jgi:hypothetical protein
MVMGRILSLCAAVILAGGIVAPVRAGDFGEPGAMSYWDIRDAIYQKVNLIAHLEANPEIDDGYKGPIITTAHAEIHRLRAMLGPPPPLWLTPCCYTRRPLHIR